MRSQLTNGGQVGWMHHGGFVVAAERTAIMEEDDGAAGAGHLDRP